MARGRRLEAVTLLHHHHELLVEPLLVERRPSGVGIGGQLEEALVDVADEARLRDVGRERCLPEHGRTVDELGAVLREQRIAPALVEASLVRGAVGQHDARLFQEAEERRLLAADAEEDADGAELLEQVEAHVVVAVRGVEALLGQRDVDDEAQLRPLDGLAASSR
jgi:hypothetical protein